MKMYWLCVLWAFFVAVGTEIPTPAYQQAPFIRWPPRDLIVSHGGSIKLSCYVMGYPFPNVTWFKDGIAIRLQEKPYIRILPNFTLVIRNPVHNSNRKDGGQYSCIARNSAGTEKSKNATVIVPYIDSVFKRSPSDNNQFQTKSHRFECIPPNGYPKPTVVEWRKDGKTLFRITDDKATKKYDDRWLVFRQGKVRILSFWTRLDSAGLYTCLAQNSEGVRESRPARLTVKVIPPEVTLEPLTEVYVGDKAQLHCKIKVPLPVPQREWSKVNGEMPDKSRYIETDDGKLIISKVKESDSGDYKCFTRNKAGEMSVIGKLMVYKKPVYVIRPTDVKIPIGETAKFECKAKYGKKINMKYYFNNKWYSQTSTNSDVYVNALNELIIPNVKLSQSAKFVRCFIEDSFYSFGSDHVLLTVLNTNKKPPSLSLTPLQQTVTEGDRLTLTCTASGSGQLEFKWYSAGDGIELSNKVSGVTIKSFPNGSNFTMDNVIPSDGRAYRCKVSGDGGTQSLISMITVKPTSGKAPGLIPFLYVRDVKATSVKLIWGNPQTKLLSPVTSYIINIKNMKKGSQVRTITVLKEQTKKVIKKLSPSNVYVFSVVAVNKFGWGPPKDSSNVETKQLIPTTNSPVDGAVDKLLNVVLRLNQISVTDDKIEVGWNPVQPDRITGYGIYFRQSGYSNYKYIEVADPSRSSYIIKRLYASSEYEIKMKAYNQKYDSQESSVLTVKTKKRVYVPAPVKVGIVKKDNENLEIHWAPPDGFDKIEGVLGYQLSCLDSRKNEFYVGLVNKQAKRYILSGLDTWESYTLSLTIKTKFTTGYTSKKFNFVLGNMKDGAVIGAPPDRPVLVATDKDKIENSILDVIKEPWFIATIGTLVWLFLFVIVVLLCCRRARKRRQQRRFNDSARGLIIQGNRTMDGADSTLTRTRWENSTAYSEVTPKRKRMRGCCRSKTDSMDEDDFPNRADIKPLMTYTRHDKHESVELRPKGPNSDINILKENNTAIAMKNGYMVDMPLNNELNLSHRPHDSGDEYSRLKGRVVGLSQELTPSLHSDTGSRREPMRSKTDSAERRHAEIVRTAANKSFPDAELVNVMETNPQASWKREKPPKDSPKLPQKPPGENTLRRQAKSQFKPLPQLEVLNWADGLPNANDPPPNEGSQVSAPSSPKLSSSASMFSEGNPRPESRMSHNGSATSLNKYPFEKRRRKTSNASSMLSSELYQSEMDPSAYSDIVSERKKKKDKAVPPPIDLEGLTSDILLQWAESVTNSSPSSSGSSSPSRLSGISSEGSIYTDEDFAQAVAAVAECGGFNMDYDYSLPGMPGTQPPYPSTRNAKMNKIDEVLQQRSKLRNNAGTAAAKTGTEPHPLPGANNSFIPQISMSSYLTGTGKGTPSSYSGQSGIPRSSHHRKRSNPADKNLRYGTGFQDVDSASSVQFKPLTVSSLMEHDSSLGRDKKEAKPLTVSNLRQHDTSLDRALKQNERPAMGREPPPVYSDVHSNKSNNLIMPEAPLSVISALERNESINSNSKDSANSSSRQDSEVENGGTSERNKKHAPMLNGLSNPQC